MYNYFVIILEFFPFLPLELLHMSSHLLINLILFYCLSSFDFI